VESPRKKEKRPASREGESRDEKRTSQSTIDRARDPREKRDSRRRRRNYRARHSRWTRFLVLATTTRWTTGKENPRGKRTTVDPTSNKQDKHSPPSWLLAIPQGVDGKNPASTGDRRLSTWRPFHRGRRQTARIKRASSKLSIAKQKELGDPVASFAVLLTVLCHRGGLLGCREPSSFFGNLESSTRTGSSLTRGCVNGSLRFAAIDGDV